MPPKPGPQFSGIISNPESAKIASDIYAGQRYFNDASPKEAWKTASSDSRYWEMADNWAPGISRKDASIAAQKKRKEKR